MQEPRHRVLRKGVRAISLCQLILILTTFACESALLYPILARAQERARKSECSSHLRRCVLAVSMYTDDWEGRLPSSKLSAASVTPTQAEVCRFLTAKFEGATPPGAKPVSWGQVLYCYLGSGGQTNLYCPSDTRRETLSYWWKYAADEAWRALGVTGPDEYAAPGSQVILYEHSAWHYGSAYGIRERAMVQYGFLDGHVQTACVRGGPTSFPSRSDESSGLAAMRPGSPMFFNCSHSTGEAHPGVADYVDPRSYIDISY